MGNTLGIVVDFAVESLAEIREKSQESNINAELKKFEVEMNHLNDISQNYVSSISIPLLLKISENTIYGYSDENGVYIVAIYDIIQNSIKIIHSADPLYIEKVFHKSNHDDFFVSSTSMDYTKEIYHYGTEKLEEWDIDSRFNCKLVKSIRYFNFASISYFKAKFIQKINYIGMHYAIFLDQKGSILIFNSDYKVLHVDLDKNEVEKKLESNFLDISVTENFIFSPKNGFRNIRTNQQMEFISFRCISKNEVFLLTFNAQKSIGEIFYLHNYHIDPDVEPVASFSIIGVSDQIYFSDDSEFVFILEKNKTECNLLVFSIRETKFVFRKKLNGLEFIPINRITLQKNFVLCHNSYTKLLIELLEINIPIRMIPYSIHFPTDVHFIFK
jgi:hypothetical protein